MTDLDDKLRGVLREQFGTDDFPEGADAAVLDLVIETFRGRNRWLTYIGVFGGIVFMALGVVAAFQFFGATEIRDMILWAIIFVSALMAISMMKVWFWMEMEKNAILRELKRIELQLAKALQASGEPSMLSG